MEIKDNNKVCIITPLSPKLDKREALRLIKEFQTINNKSIALDLGFVQDCNLEFFNQIKEFASTRKLSLFNISSDMFVIINFFNLDKIFNLYVSELDFEEEKHQLLNRKFSLV